MKISNLHDLKCYFSYESTAIIGLATQAINRLGLEDIYPDYRIAATNWFKDHAKFRENVDIFCLEELDGDLPLSSRLEHLFTHSKFIDYIASFTDKPSFFSFQSNSIIKQVCEEQGWRYLMPDPSFTARFEHKVNFRQLLEKNGLKGLFPDYMLVKKGQLSFDVIQLQLGLPFVLQLAVAAGGEGTFIIETEDIFNKVIEAQNQNQFIVSQYISGHSLSILSVITPWGSVYCPAQVQIINPFQRADSMGQYNGHDWTLSKTLIDSAAQAQSRMLVEQVGEILRTEGFKGMFGLDLQLALDGRVYLIECNPRITAAIPMLDWINLAQSSIPLSALHILAFIGHDIALDIGTIQKELLQPKDGSHLKLRSLLDVSSYIYIELKPGTYSFNGRLNYVSDNYKLEQLQKGQFLLVNIPQEGMTYSKRAIIATLISPTSILDKNGGLNKQTREIVDAFYLQCRQQKITKNIENSPVDKLTNRGLNHHLAPTIT